MWEYALHEPTLVEGSSLSATLFHGEPRRQHEPLDGSQGGNLPLQCLQPLYLPEHQLGAQVGSVRQTERQAADVVGEMLFYESLLRSGEF